jgi:hypothetical protein
MRTVIFPLLFCSMSCLAQNTVNIDSVSNPFYKFIGEWTLKDDKWSHNWGGGPEHIKIPNHYTVTNALNTDNSLLQMVDTPPAGHILWVYNPVKKEIYHLSSFGTERSGVGSGSVNKNGDVTLKVAFQGEVEGTYRIYTYKWINYNEYELKSIQYGSDDKPTGLFYGGTFVRLIRRK